MSIGDLQRLFALLLHWAKTDVSPPTFEDLKEMYEFEYKLSQSQNLQYSKWYEHQLREKISQVRNGLLSGYANYLVGNFLENGEDPSILFDVQKDSPEISDIINMFEELASPAFLSESLGQQVVIIHRGLNTVHTTGQMIEHIPFDKNTPLGDHYYANWQEFLQLPGEERPGNSMYDVFFTDLTEGKFIPDWDHELRKESRTRSIFRRIVHTSFRWNV